MVSFELVRSKSESGIKPSSVLALTAATYIGIVLSGIPECQITNENDEVRDPGLIAHKGFGAGC